MSEERKIKKIDESLLTDPNSQIGSESSFLRLEALNMVDPLDSQRYSTQKYRLLAHQVLVFGTSVFLAGLVKQMRLVKPWKDP
jgi:hypothetical protein